MMVKSEIKASRNSDHLSVFSIIEAHAKRIPDESRLRSSVGTGTPAPITKSKLLIILLFNCIVPSFNTVG